MTAAALQQPAPDWLWGDVAAARADGVGAVRLTHAGSGAELVVRGGRCAAGGGYADAPPAARHALARAGAVLRLRTRGRYLLHAAAVVDPRGRAWLLAGDSGCGKSTLAYALARAGWEVLADDGVPVELLREGGATRALAHAWRAPLMVSADLAAYFPELAGRAPLSPDDARRRVAVDAAARGTRVGRAPVAALLFPARGARDAATPLGATAALAGLVRQSPWAMLGDAHAPQHLAALRDLAAAVPAFRLEHTERLLRRVGHMLAALPT